MPPKPKPFRAVYRAFEGFEFNEAKSIEILEDRDFDLAYVRRMFPGYVLERQDTRPYPEPRFQVIGEVRGEAFVVVYTPRGQSCSLITASAVEGFVVELWHDDFS